MFKGYQYIREEAEADFIRLSQLKTVNANNLNIKASPVKGNNILSEQKSKTLLDA